MTHIQNRPLQPLYITKGESLTLGDDQCTRARPREALVTSKNVPYLAFGIGGRSKQGAFHMRRLVISPTHMARWGGGLLQLAWPRPGVCGTGGMAIFALILRFCTRLEIRCCLVLWPLHFCCTPPSPAPCTRSNLVLVSAGMPARQCALAVRRRPHGQAGGGSTLVTRAKLMQLRWAQ